MGLSDAVVDTSSAFVAGSVRGARACVDAAIVLLGRWDRVETETEDR